MILSDSNPSSSLLSSPSSHVASALHDANGLCGGLEHLTALWKYEPENHVRMNWSSLAFWTTCVAAMAGCGLFSGLLHRRREQGRPPVRRLYRKHTAETVTSSEDDSEESSSSIRKATEVDERELLTAYQRFSSTGS
jgi:hypothetical protein